jgi:LPPG:FO 2-phospho-L-lactate transferase
MSDQPVRTLLSTQAGDLAMQDYFVRQRSEPRVTAVKYAGAETASPSPTLLSAMEQANLLVLCPSNPYLSVGPILAIPGVREGLESFKGLRVAVSPIVGGSALRGPAAKMMGELGDDVSCVGVARQYSGIMDAILIDHQDASLAIDIEEMGITAVPASIIMETEADKMALAEQILGMAANNS